MWHTRGADAAYLGQRRDVVALAVQDARVVAQRVGVVGAALFDQHAGGREVVLAIPAQGQQAARRLAAVMAAKDTPVAATAAKPGTYLMAACSFRTLSLYCASSTIWPMPAG